LYKESRPLLNSGDAVNTPAGWAGILRQDSMASLKLRFDPRWHLIQPIMLKGSTRARILDAGCGRGDWVNFLYQQGIDAVGLDFSEEMIEFNSAHHQGSFHFGHLQSIPFPAENFDGIISWGVIEHDEAGPEKAIAEFYRVLKPHGYLFVTVPIDNERQRRASGAQFPNGDSFFQYFMSQTELEDYLRSADFDIVSSGPCGRPHAALLWPEKYPHVQGLQLRLMQLAAYVINNTDTINMVHAIGRKR
jgi:ubiquinone/menaquinone biosynthesis C-methylase UbiE